MKTLRILSVVLLVLCCLGGKARAQGPIAVNYLVGTTTPSTCLPPAYEFFNTGDKTTYLCGPSGTYKALPGSGTFTALSGDATSTATGGATNVVGLQNHLLPTLTTGYLNWTGSAWAYSAGGSMTWPAAAGIMVYGGSSAYGTSLTAPAGAIVGAGQANTYSTGLQDFSSVTMKFPSSVTVGANSITLPVSAGTLALVSQLPSVGSWGALAYPSWASGTPFVKMTAAGTFSLDTNTYQAAGTYVTPTTLDNNTLPASLTTLTASGLSTLKEVLPTGVTVAALPGSGNTNYEQFWVTDPTSLVDCTVGSSSGFAHACMWNGLAWVTALPVYPETLLPTQISRWSVSDGLVSMAALGTTATPNVVFGVNGSGVTQTITAITCFVDAGSGTVFTLTDGTNNLLGATGTCSTSGASIAVSGSHFTIVSGGHMVYTVTPDSTAKAVTLAVSGTL
jgi:hypothetical protein